MHEHDGSVSVRDRSKPADLGHFDPSQVEESHRRLRAAREQHPWAHSDFGPVLLRYEGVVGMLNHESLVQIGFGLLEMSGVTGGLLHEWWGRIMFAHEGERHRQLRDVARGWLTRGRVEGLRPLVAAETERIVSRWSPGEVVDVAVAIASPVPSWTMCSLLGVDGDDVAALGHATTDLGMAFGMFGPDEHRRIEQALDLLLEWGDRTLRVAEPGTLAHTIAASAGTDGVDWDDAVALIVNLQSAGQDTTRFLIGNALWLLGRYPEWWTALVERQVTADAVVEETLRYQPPVTDVVRVATADVSIDGLDLGAGDAVFGSLWSAGRDPEAYHDPEVFDPACVRRQTLSFGRGPHYCLGAAMARLVASVTLDTLATTCSSLRIDWKNAQMRKGDVAITGVQSLGVEVS